MYVRIVFRNKNVSCCQGRLFRGLSYRVNTNYRYLTDMYVYDNDYHRARVIMILFMRYQYIGTRKNIRINRSSIANFTCFYSIKRCAFCLVSCSFKVVSPLKHSLSNIDTCHARFRTIGFCLVEVFLDSSYSYPSISPPPQFPKDPYYDIEACTITPTRFSLPHSHIFG